MELVLQANVFVVYTTVRVGHGRTTLCIARRLGFGMIGSVERREAINGIAVMEWHCHRKDDGREGVFSVPQRGQVMKTFESLQYNPPP
jgi:hypothetical protein